MNLTLILLVAFFVSVMVLQKVSGKYLCALCASVSLTWLTLLILYFNSYQVDLMMVGILMGGSAVGIMYYLFKDKNSFQIFKFPFLITLFWLIYLLVAGVSNKVGKDFLIIGVLWFAFIAIYLFNKNGHWKEWGQRIIECCRNW